MIRTMLYDLLYCVGLLFYMPFGMVVKRRGWDYFKSRWSIPSLPDLGSDKRKIVWVHAVSVGEINAAVPLVNGLKSPVRVFLTTTTPAGYENAKRRLTGVDVFLSPFDVSFVIKRFIKKMAPSIIVIMETEIWPNLINIAKSMGIKVVIANGRISDKSYKRYIIAKKAIAPVLKGVDKVLAQTQEYAQRFANIGAKNVYHVGNLKFDIEMSSEPLKRPPSLENRFVMVCGSTHNPEEAMIFDAFSRVKRGFEQKAQLACIIAPRHVERAGQVCSIAQSKGLSYSLFSQVGWDFSTDVLVVDKIGVLSSLYSLADVAFLGGSLIKKGGQNPIEAAYWARPIFFGRHMENFYEIARALVDAGGAQVVHDLNAWLMDMIGSYIAGGEFLAQMGKKAKDVLVKNKGSLERHLEHITSML